MAVGPVSVPCKFRPQISLVASFRLNPEWRCEEARRPRNREWLTMTGKNYCLLSAFMCSKKELISLARVSLVWEYLNEFDSHVRQ